MTKNEPVDKPFARQETACFFYGAAGEITSAGQPLQSFFGSIQSRDDPPFLQVFDENEFTAHWNRAIHLREGESTAFTAVAKGDPTLRFSFDIIRPPSDPVSGSSMLFVKVTKSYNDTSVEEQYAEFVDLASHDLDSPMRKLSLFSERLFSKLEGSTDEDLIKYRERMLACIADMRKIVENLALLSKLNSKSISLQPCNTSTIVKNIVSGINEIRDHEKLQASIAKLPTLIGDCAQYQILFAQLIENSVKFRKANTPVEVSIQYEILPDDKKGQYHLPAERIFHQITIADNGIGFDNESAERIFTPFIRLNGKSEYPGNGIGLALCKKIVENHRGVIYAEGNERNGASFTLILPQSPH